MKYFLGVDAGGTKTIGALADEQRELARARTGTIKRLRTGSEDARENLRSLFEQLANAAGVDLKSISSVCIGTSGYRVPLVTEWIRDTVPQLSGGELIVCGDEEIALEAAFFGGPGVLVIAGTGSIVVGRTSAGDLLYSGGWGPALADEGSGYWIGHEGLRSAFRARNEGRPTELLESVMTHWELASLNDLVEKANATPAPDFSQLVPVVIACAERDDPVALEVLKRGGEELAHLVLLVLRQLHASGGQSPRIAFTGSVLHRIVLVRDAMVSALRRELPLIDVLPEAVDPINGALWRARNLIK